MHHPIYIASLGSISPLGTTLDAVWKAYQNDEHKIISKEFDGHSSFVAPLAEQTSALIAAIAKENSTYASLDKSVLYAMFAARQALAESGWKDTTAIGINFGSSRGATTLFETYHSEYITKKKASTLSSPTTTLGNISTWVAHDLQTQGPDISHSITCSTALHALLNGIAWLQAEMATQFIVGGSEAALTPFTIAQMKALKITATQAATYPCKALDLSKKRNTMVLGEGAAALCITSEPTPKALAKIEGIGYATEILAHNISISSDAACFQKSMKMALGERSPQEVDAIVMHAPGTLKGDRSEYVAIETVFGEHKPFLTTNKWKLGHTFGASGLLSVELAILMLQHQKVIAVPFAAPQKNPKQLKTILVNAVGFGGNAVSVLLTQNK